MSTRDQNAHPSFNLKLPNGLLPLGPMPVMMGILNVTPDSFSDGGQSESVAAATQHFAVLRDAGADIIDIGGESTRPGADSVNAQTELDRVLPVIDEIRSTNKAIPISIDTYKAVVADQAVQAGATLINDVYGAQKDREIADVAALYGLPFIAMHWDNERDPAQDIISQMLNYFENTLNICTHAGISANQIVLDPGFGFAKSLSENYEILRRLDELKILGFPLLIGTSRKSMIGKLLDLPTERRLPGTIASNVIAYQNGGHIFRVHDVAQNREALQVAHAARYGATISE